MNSEKYVIWCVRKQHGESGPHQSPIKILKNAPAKSWVNTLNEVNFQYPSIYYSIVSPTFGEKDNDMKILHRLTAVNSIISN